MINDYLKQLEKAIIPKQYNSEYFKQGIVESSSKGEALQGSPKYPSAQIVSSKRDSMNVEESKDLNAEQENMKLLNEYLRRSGYKDTAETVANNPNKVKLYQKILESDIRKTKNEKGSYSSNELQQVLVEKDHNLNNLNNEQSKLRSSTVKNDIRASLQEKSVVSGLGTGSKPGSPMKKPLNGVDKNEKFTQLHLQSINYRHEIEILQNTLAALEKKFFEQQNIIDTLEKQKENDDKYLLKLEDIYKQEQMKNKNNLNISLNVSNTNNNISSGGLAAMPSGEDNIIAGINFKDKKQLNNVITSLLHENYKLRNFQNQVLEISKNYDDINENIIENMRSCQNFFKSHSYPSSRTINEYLENFNKILNSSVEMVQSKQKNYNLTLASKEDEIVILSREIEKLKASVETIKNDGIKDNKILHDYENENIMLQNKVVEFEKLIEAKKKKLVVKDKNEEKIKVVRSSVDKMMSNFNKNLDLNDKTNQKFVENLTAKLK